MNFRESRLGMTSIIFSPLLEGKILFTLSFCIVHMLLTGFLFIWSFSVVMANAIDPYPLPVSGKILVVISEIFQWPLIPNLGQIELLRNVLPNFMLYILLFLNSLLWALVALVLFVWIQKIRSRRASHFSTLR
jgi:hypothetical protein